MSENLHLFRSHESRIESHAKLTDHGGVCIALFLESLQKFLRTGASDGAKVIGQFLAGHPDAMIYDGNRAGFFVSGDVDFERKVPLIDALFGQLLETQLLKGIGSIGNELPNKDLLVGIKRMDDDIKKLTDFCLKGLCLRFAHNRMWKLNGRKILTPAPLSIPLTF